MIRFEAVHNILDRAIALDPGKAFLFAIDEEAKKLIIRLNTDEQLGKFGIDSDGDDLGEYADLTVQRRTDLGLQVDHVDFKVTGNYWNSWEVKVNERFFEILVDMERFTELVSDLGFSEDHVGLTEKNMDVLVQLLVGKYQQYVRQQLSA